LPEAAPKTIQEMQTYAWDSEAAQRGEEKPMKLHDHGRERFATFLRVKFRTGDWLGESSATDNAIDGVISHTA
jgi:hypothetical protein